MSTQIQFLRTDQVQLRPDPNVLANGMPLLNFNEQEPGLFFKARDGSLFKVGPTAVGDTAPNSGANGFAGNVKGETWLDTSGLSPMLKVYDGIQWVPSSDPGGVSSVALSMTPSIFDVAGSPITSAGVLSVTLQPQVRNRVLAGPLQGAASVPTFRALGSDDIPGLDGSKIVAGFINQSRIPSLDATKITSGVFNSARIPGIDATKIISGVLPYAFGGTGISGMPQSGELLIGGISTGWRKNTLTPGVGIDIINGPGTIQIKVQPPGVSGSVLYNNGGILGSSPSFSFDQGTSTLDLNGVLDVSGRLDLSLGNTGPAPISFEANNGNAVSLIAPTSIASNYTLTLPQQAPNSTVNPVLVATNAGTTSFTDTLTLYDLGVKSVLRLKDTSGSYETEIRCPGLIANRTLTLPSNYGSGGFVKASSGGDLSVTSNVDAQSVSANTFFRSSSSPSRQFVSGAASLNVTSNGTYTLLDIPADGVPTSVSFTVFVHDEDATVGTGTLTASYNAHYNGSTAVLSAAGNKVDSWSGTEPTFSVDYSSTFFRIRTTTASGSNELNFMLDYTYVRNIGSS